MMKFMSKEDQKNVRKKRLCAKRKKDQRASHSPELVKGNNYPKKVMTNARLTVPHMQPGIFLKGKSTVSYQRKQGTKFNELNTARMNEKLTEILNFATNSNLVPLMTHNKENVESSKGCPLLGDGNDREILSLNYSGESMKNKHQQVQEKNYVSLHSSEDTSEEEEEGDSKYTEHLINDVHIKELQSQEKELEEDSNYLDFKKFLIYFDKNVAFKETVTDFISIEKGDLKRKQRKISSDFRSTRQYSSVNENNKNSYFFKTSNKECENESSKNSSKTCLNNIRCVKTNPKQNPNYNIFQSKNPTKLKIIDQTQGHPVNKADDNHKTTKFSENMFTNFHGPIFDSQEVQSQNEEKCFKTKHSCNDIVHSEAISLLNPLNFLEITMTQPEPLQSLSMSSKSEPFYGLQDWETDVPTSSFSGPPNLCVSKEDFHHRKQETKSETFFDVYKPQNQSDPSPSPLGSEIFFKNYPQHIFYEPSSSLNTRFSEDKMFQFLNTEPKTSKSDNPNKFLVLSPLTSDGIDIDHCSDGKKDSSKYYRYSIPETPSDICFQDGLQTYSDSSSEPYIVSTYHPQVNLSSTSSNKESDIRKNNFWHRRKMY